MLERWAKTKGEMYVRKSKESKRKSKKGATLYISESVGSPTDDCTQPGKVGEGEGVVDVDSDDEDSRPGGSMWNEHMFTFEKYENVRCSHPLIAILFLTPLHPHLIRNSPRRT
jgi:hypothetical protein